MKSSEFLTPKAKAHFLTAGPYTCAGPYRDFYQSLPDDPRELGNLLSHQILHRVTLHEGNLGANDDLRYGDMREYPWHRMRCEDDIFLTAPAMTAELLRLDSRGFLPDRKVEHKLVLTCRYVSVLVSAIYKAKGIPCRSRAGFAPYFKPGVSMDHWINQVWDSRENRWRTIDADGLYREELMGIDQYDLKESEFHWAAGSWLAIRRGKTDGKEFLYADGLGTCSLRAVIRYLFYDFHALMNDDISYLFLPAYIDGKLDSLTERDLEELDGLAELMLSPDENFSALQTLWDTQRKFRILNSPLVGDSDHLSGGKEGFLWK